MDNKLVLLISLLAFLVMFAGCATYVPVEKGRGTTYRLIETGYTEMGRLELDYGTSHNLAKYGQIFNPEPENKMEPVTGLDGQASEIIIDKYNKSFEKERQRPVYNINIGGF